MPSISRCLLIVAFAAALAACGNKGALVLPDQQPSAKKTDTQPQTKAAKPPASDSGSH